MNKILINTILISLLLLGGCKDKITEMCEDDRDCGENLVRIDCQCHCLNENYSRIAHSTCIGPSPDYYWVQSGPACLDSFGLWIIQKNIKNAIEKKENDVNVGRSFGYNNPNYGSPDGYFAFYEDWSAEWGTHYVLHQNTGFFQTHIKNGVYWACPEYHHYDDYDMDIVFKNKDLSTAYVYIHFWHNVSPNPGTRTKKYGEMIEAVFKNNTKTIPLK